MESLNNSGKFVVANWKQNINSKGIKEWFVGYAKTLNKQSTASKKIIAPPFLYLKETLDLSKDLGFEISAQNVSIYEKGAHTGEVGISQIVDYCRYCIIGHSETKDKLKDILIKRDLCLEYKIIPIICFTDPVDINSLYRDGVVLAWENPSHISKDGEYKPENTLKIKRLIVVFKSKLPINALILYGGSVNRQNANELGNIPELDGVLVGHASLDPTHFQDILGAFDR